jgi:hypothetical protein
VKGLGVAVAYRTVHGDPTRPDHGEKAFNFVFFSPPFECRCDPSGDCPC